MRNLNNLVLGGILVLLGLVFLGNNLNWFEIDVTFRRIAHWWPLLLVVAGIGIMLDPFRRFGNAITLISLFVMIPLAIFSLVDEGVDRIESKIESELDEDIFDKDIRIQRDSISSNDVKTQDFLVENNNTKNAILNFNGGAATFLLEKTVANTFEGETKLTFGSYKLESEVKDGNQLVDFKLFDKEDEKGDVSIDLDEDDFGNLVKLKLNPTKIWDLNFEVGAGDMDFNLADFRVEKLKIETGAADVKLRFGALQNESKIKIKSGMARVIIEIPKEVGSKIEMDGAINAKDFEGFDKSGRHEWKTENFDSATKKIYIEAESGLSAIKVVRY